jgi:hypothetical protein
MAKRFELWMTGICVIGLLAPQLAGANGGVKASMVGMGAPSRVETGQLQGNEKTEQAASPKSEPSAEAVPVWLPRREGNRAARVGGATRGATQDVTLHALVPLHDDAALTLSAQPTLYWHLSESTSYSVNFTLIDPTAIDPLVDVTLISGPFEAGVHAVDLSAHGATLAPGKQYHWFVAVVPDPERRSADIIARGAVERIEADSALQSELDAAEAGERANALAKGGIWYDALQALQTDIESHPAEAAPRARRAALLEQAGLSTLAAVD